jgi:glutamate racemase
MLERYVAPLLDGGADTLVLGCTHYPFVRFGIEQVLAAHDRQDVVLIDTGDAVARQLGRLLAAGALLRTPSPTSLDAPARLHGFTTAEPATLAAAFRVLLDLDPPVTRVEV